MCGEIDAEITRLEAQVKDLRELCERQRIALQQLFNAFAEIDDAFRDFADAVYAVQTASSMTGTSEK